FPRGDARPAIERQHETERMDQVRSVAQEERAFVQCLVDERNVALFEVAQSAVNQFRRDAAGSRGKISFIDESDSQSSQGCIEGHPGAGDPATEDEQVEGLVRERVDVPLHASSPLGGLPAGGQNLRSVGDWMWSTCGKAALRASMGALSMRC